jgi:hypothetical protein
MVKYWLNLDKKLHLTILIASAYIYIYIQDYYIHICIIYSELNFVFLP